MTSLFKTGLGARLPVILALACWAGTLAKPAHAQDPSTLSLEELETRVTDILSTTCARVGCHSGSSPQMGMNLSKESFYGHTVGVASREMPALMRIHPGQPDSSYLVKKVRGDDGIAGAQMPLTGEKLTQNEIHTIEAWVRKLGSVDTTRVAEEQSAMPVVALPFDGWRVVNVPTTRTLDKGLWLFYIGHRFVPRLSDGYDAFFGLDGSGSIFLRMGYAVTDRLLISLGRGNAGDDVELEGRYGILRQSLEGGSPIGLAAQVTGNWISQKRPGQDRLNGDVLKLTGQVMAAREVTQGLSFLVVPGILLNPAENVSGEDPLVTVGLGGRWRVKRNMAIIGEWVPIVAGYTRTRSPLGGGVNRFDSFGGGLEISIGGHVFQIVLTNSVGLTADQYLVGGDLDIADIDKPDLRLGFNIFRILRF